MCKRDPRRGESRVDQVGFAKVSPRFGPAFTGKVPQAHRIPRRGRLRVLFNQIVCKHEQGRPKAWDVVHARQVERQCCWMSRDPCEDPASQTRCEEEVDAL